MGKHLSRILISLVLLTTAALAGTVTLLWDAPTQNEDGTPLTDLAGYEVNTTDVGNTTTYTTPDLAPGSYRFVVRAYDTAGNKSADSNEVVIAVTPTGTPTPTVTPTVTPTPVITPNPTNLVYEAENMTLLGYVAKTFANPDINSTQRGIELPTTVPSGTATTTFTGPTGNYTLVVSYVSEEDGQPLLKVTVDSHALATFTFELSDSDGNASTDRWQLKTKVFSDVPVTFGDAIKLEGQSNGSAWCRVDKVTFIPIVPTPTPTPTVTPTATPTPSPTPTPTPTPHPLKKAVDDLESVQDYLRLLMNAQ